MEKRKQIEEILLNDYGCFDDFTVDKLLDLFSVVGRSEQLLAFGWYIMEHSNVNDGKTAKDYLQEFLSQ